MSPHPTHPHHGHHQCVNVAVYGTLRAGGQYHAVLGDDAVFCGACRLPGWLLYHNQAGAYPYAVRVPTEVPGGGDDGILVEIWAVSTQTFLQVDELEEYPQYYRRSEVMTPLGILAWLYHTDEQTAAGHPRLAHGDWGRIDPAVAAAADRRSR